MTTEEFIAWFDGFTGRLKGRPSAKDWAEIVARIEAIDSRSPLKAWFKGLMVKVKGVPSEAIWRQIKTHVGSEQTKASKANRLRDPFSAFDKKAREPQEPKLRYPGSNGFGKK